MSFYHFSVKNISRSDGRSSVAAAAYRAGECLIDSRTALTHDYTSKRVHHAELMLPTHAPSWAHDRGRLWNAVETSETRKNSRTARELEIAIPRELNDKQRVALARDFAQRQLVARGMCADLCFHDFDSDNPHVHILATTRNIDENGFQKKNRDWNRQELLETWRVAWANVANEHLARAGIEIRIDHRSLADQGLDREAQVKLGSKPAKRNTAASRSARKAYAEKLLHNRSCKRIARAQAALAAEQERQELKGVVEAAAERHGIQALMEVAKGQEKRAQKMLSIRETKTDLAAERQQFTLRQEADRLLRRARGVLKLARRIPALIRKLQTTTRDFIYEHKRLSEQNRTCARLQRNCVEPPIRQRDTELWSEPDFKMF